MIVTCDIKWSAHIEHICHKASITLYQIFKCIKTKNIWTWVKLFNTYIRPKLEFNTPIWSPFLVKDINLIESIQRRFTKIAFNKCSIPFTSYEDRLQKINILSLQKRREYFDLVLMYRVINNLSDLRFEDYFIIKSSDYFPRSHCLQIQAKYKFSSSQRLNSFSEEYL